MRNVRSLRRLFIIVLCGSMRPEMAHAQVFARINTPVINLQAILLIISVAVVTIAIIWAGFRMVFKGARLADVANILIGGTFIGGAAAFAAFIAA
jgi:type IV secretion system protein VirB2